jgi:hypothetical protein
VSSQRRLDAVLCSLLMLCIALFVVLASTSVSFLQRSQR